MGLETPDSPKQGDTPAEPSAAVEEDLPAQDRSAEPAEAAVAEADRPSGTSPVDHASTEEETTAEPAEATTAVETSDDRQEGGSGGENAQPAEGRKRPVEHPREAAAPMDIEQAESSQERDDERSSPAAEGSDRSQSESRDGSQSEAENAAAAEGEAATPVSLLSEEVAAQLKAQWQALHAASNDLRPVERFTVVSVAYTR